MSSLTFTPVSTGLLGEKPLLFRVLWADPKIPEKSLGWTWKEVSRQPRCCAVEQGEQLVVVCPDPAGPGQETLRCDIARRLLPGRPVK